MEAQFIPGAGPPKLKELGTTGALNLYPPCFSIILDSRKEGGEAFINGHLLLWGKETANNRYVHYVSCI